MPKIDRQSSPLVAVPALKRPCRPRRASTLFLAIAALPLLALSARAATQPFPFSQVAAQASPAAEEHSDSLPLMLGLGAVALLGGAAVLVYRRRPESDESKSDAAVYEQEATAAKIKHMTHQMEHLVQEQSKVAQQMRLLIELTSSRILGPQDLNQVFTATLKEVRRLLEVDRMVIYRFNPDESGYISVESLAAGLPKALDHVIADPCIPKEILLDYKADRVVATSDVTTANFHPDHLALMHRLQVKANVVLPILNEGQLYGLLIAHHCVQTHEWQPAEVTFLKQLALQLGVVLDRVTFLQSKNTESERAQLIKDIMLELSYAESAQETILRLPVVKIRQTLRADRVIVYQFDQSWKGTIIAESVDERYPRAMGAEIYDPCFAKEFVDKYQRGRVHAVKNIYEAGLTECHLRQLEPFAVKANLVAPIRQGNQLLGLLIAHQCDCPRNWDVQDIAFLTQVSTQVGMALDRAGLLEQKELAAEQAQHWAREQQQQKEDLNQQLIQLLMEVEKVAGGDLTVRANITNGEIGTVADFFNVVVESLRQIVTQVQRSALQVSEAVYENEAGMHDLEETAQLQAKDIHRTLTSMQEMASSIRAVADSAYQAAKVANNASATAEAGGTLMDGTVQNILNLREIVGDTAKKVKRLGEFSQEISRVISLIEKIALQTNLLAINAGIEAARAGEEGHGFAVVADEIGQLAVQSTEATREIEMIISRIQVGTSEVVQAMEQSTTQVVDGTRLIKGAKLNLEEIIHVSHQIAQFVRSISEATVSQTETSQSVMDLMKELAQVSEQISASSLKMSSSLQAAAETTQELQVSVSAFKIEM